MADHVHLARQALPAKSYLPTSVRTSPDVFKESLREAISKYLEQKHLPDDF